MADHVVFQQRPPNAARSAGLTTRVEGPGPNGSAPRLGFGASHTSGGLSNGSTSNNGAGFSVPSGSAASAPQTRLAAGGPSPLSWDLLTLQRPIHFIYRLPVPMRSSTRMFYLLSTCDRVRPWNLVFMCPITPTPQLLLRQWRCLYVHVHSVSLLACSAHTVPRYWFSSHIVLFRIMFTDWFID